MISGWLVRNKIQDCKALVKKMTVKIETTNLIPKNHNPFNIFEFFIA